MGKNEHVIEITSGTILRVIVFLLLFWILYKISNVLTIVIFSVVIASAIEHPAQWAIKRGIPRVIAVLGTYIIALMLLGGAFSLIVPPLFGELASLSADIPRLIDTATQPEGLLILFPQLPASIANILEIFINTASPFIERFSGGLFQAISSAFGGVFSVLVVIILSFYLSVQEHGIENFIRVVTPLQYEEYLLSLWERTRRKIGRWLQGQILLGFLVGVMVFLGLTILQVRFALSLAVLSAIFEIIPIFGPILAAIPAIIIAFFQEPLLGLFTLILYVVVQQLENNLIVPVVMRKAIGVHPFLIILALLVGGELGGVLGLLLAIPIVVVLVEISNDIAAKKNSVQTRP